MKLNKFKLISIILSFALSGCGESTFERMAKEYDVSEHEAYACYQEFGVDARSVLEFLLERRKPFPLSYFSDDCYDFIRYSRVYGADYQEIIHATKMGWDLGSKEFSGYAAEKKLADSRRREKEEIERVEREADERKLADEEMEYGYIKYNDEYIPLVLMLMRGEGEENLEYMARSYVNFFYYPKIQFLKEKGDEFYVKDYIDKKVSEVVESAKSAPDVPYEERSFSITLGEYDFDQGFFDIQIVRQLKRVRLFVPCLHSGLRGVCLDGKNYDGGKVYSGVPVGALPAEISYHLRGMPSYLYSPEDEARKIRRVGPLYIYGDVQVASISSVGIIYLEAKNVRLLDYSGNVIAKMCSRGEECENVFISN